MNLHVVDVVDQLQPGSRTVERLAHGVGKDVVMDVRIAHRSLEDLVRVAAAINEVVPEFAAHAAHWPRRTANHVVLSEESVTLQLKVEAL